MISHEPFLVFSRQNDKRKKNNDNVGYVNDLCSDSWNPKFLIFSSFCGYLVLLVFPFSVCCHNGADFAQGRCPGCLAGGRYTPFLMIARKKGTHTGFTNDNKTITKTITFGIKNGPCETRPFFLFSSPFPFSCVFLYFSFSFSFPFSCPFSFPFSFDFSVPFPFVSLSFPYFFPFPFPFLFLFPFLAHVNSLIKVWNQRLEKRYVRGKKKTSGKTIWKGSGFLQTPEML